MHKSSYYIVNAITVYRIAAAFLLFFLVVRKETEIFKWMLAFSFFTDAIDGYLARRYKAVSAMGAKIDSVADDLTILVAAVGVVVLKRGFILHELSWVLILLALYLFQLSSALILYHKISSFHTYSAKVAAVLQGCFLILLFFLHEWPLLLFHIAAIATVVNLAEEIILVFKLPEWKSDVKGLFWLNKGT
jgi:phosphatidylglycerophosphate synthase